MANHWLREMRFLQSPARSGSAFFAKCLCLWMYRVLGYTNFTEDVSGEAGNETYDPTDASYGYEKTGANGVLNNTNFNFVDATASAFTAGDAGKWLLIVDTTNPENSGWYRVASYTDATTVVIDFRSGATEYPTAQSGLAWYLMDEDYETPIVSGSYFRLRTPHTDGWEVEVKLAGSRHYEIRVSLDHDWTASGKILDLRQYWHNSNVDANTQYCYAEGESSGAHLNLWWQNTGGGTGLWTMGKVTPYETMPTHPAEELWVAGGYTSISANSVDHTEKDDAAGNNWYGEVWRNAMMASRNVYCVEWTRSTSALGVFLDPANTVNQRTGKNDIGPGITVITDFQNNIDEYELLGELKGNEQIRANLARQQTIDDAGTKDKIHIRNGWLFPWPGFTAQYTP